jgi:hypothetical protein
MSHQSIEAIRSYIAKLEIPEADASLATVDRASAAVFADETPGAAVAAGSLVSFVGGISGVQKSDVLNSTLLAQLAATKKFNRFTQADEWYEIYRGVLSNVGWNVPAFSFHEYKTSGSSLVLSDTIIEILRAISTKDELKIIEAALSGLRDKKENQESLILFDQESNQERRATFQILPVGKDRGDIVMDLALMKFTSDRHVTRFLWFSWNTGSSVLFEDAQKAVLNEEVYSQVRQSVIAKLGNNAKRFVEAIEI